MSELRWALLGLGLLFLAGLAIWERRRSRRRPAHAQVLDAPPEAPPVPRPRRVEPSLDAKSMELHRLHDEPLQVPTIHPVEPLRVAEESAVDIPARAMPKPIPAIQWPPVRSDRVLSLRVVGVGGEMLQGRSLRNALEGAGLVAGPQSIYHLADAEGAVMVSAANLVRPGSLDPAQMDAQEFRGISLFSVLPGPLPAAAMLDGLVDTARALAERLGAQVQDERGASLDAQRLQQLRQSLPEDGVPPGDEPQS